MTGDDLESGGGMDVAVVGMACRFPGAATVEDFWRLLDEGRESTTWFSEEELLAAGVGRAALDDPRYVRAGQVPDDVEGFDAELFGIPGEEAEMLDPQHRLLLECAQEVLESAGHDPALTEDAVGVFAGVGMNTYLLRNLAERYRQASPLEHYRLMLTNDKDFATTRVSYRLGLRGPSLGVGTACSTALVAVHTACLSLLAGESDMAIAGAAHVTVPQAEGYLHQEGMIRSPDGHCRAFDAKAAGTVLGSGAGVVLLKRLADAQADGDTVHAVIRGSAVNNDGSLKTGYTAPSVAGQAAVIAEAQAVAGVGPDGVDYVEAHGTGTPLGDPVEVEALDEVFAGAPLGSVGLGSAKTNVGHLDTAAGVVGLIKAVLMLRHRRLVPSLHFDVPNPDIPFGENAFHVVTESTEWRSAGRPRRAGVSSFGIGGTNAHVVLEEPPAVPEREPDDRPRLVLVSAHTTGALDRLCGELGRHLNAAPELRLGDVAHTLAAGRPARRYRRALVGLDAGDAALTLALGDEDRIRAGEAPAERPLVALLLGDTVGGAGSTALPDLLDEVPAFAAHAAEAVGAGVAAGVLDAGTDAAAVLARGDATAAVVGSWALARLLGSWGVEVSALAGRGTGRLVAAGLAGVLTLPDVLRLAAGGTGPITVAGAAAIPLLDPATGAWTTPERAADPATWTTPEPDRGRPAGWAPGHLVVSLDTLAVEDGDDRDPAGADAVPGSSGARLLDLVGRLWVAGVDVDRAALHAGQDVRRVVLPTVPHERRRHWIEPGATVGVVDAATGTDLRRRLDEAADDQERVELIGGYLADEIARVLARPDGTPPDRDQNLFDMGLESLVLIEITARLADELAYPVAPSAFVEYPTVRTFTVNLAEEMGYHPVTTTAGPAAARTSRRAARARDRR